MAQTVTTGQIGNAVAGILKSVAGTLGNVISTLFSTYAYLIKSIVNIGSPKSVKDKINTDFNKKLKDLSRSYERSLDNIKLNKQTDKTPVSCVPKFVSGLLKGTTKVPNIPANM